MGEGASYLWPGFDGDSGCDFTGLGVEVIGGIGEVDTSLVSTGGTLN